MSETNERGTLDENPEETRARSDESRQGSSKASRESAIRADGGATDDDRRDRRRETGGQTRQEDPGPGEGFARATTRWLLAIVGLFVVLFAVGQAFGVPLLSWVGEALSSQTGQWLVVAFIGLLIVYAAANLDWR